MSKVKRGGGGVRLTPPNTPPPPPKAWCKYFFFEASRVKNMLLYVCMFMVSFRVKDPMGSFVLRGPL